MTTFQGAIAAEFAYSQLGLKKLPPFMTAAFMLNRFSRYFLIPSESLAELLLLRKLFLLVIQI